MVILESNRGGRLTIARNLRNDISSSLLSLELMANLEVLIAFFDSADFKLDLILQHLNALDGDGDRTVFRCLFQRSATSKSLSLDCNKKKSFKVTWNYRNHGIFKNRRF